MTTSRPGEKTNKPQPLELKSLTQMDIDTSEPILFNGSTGKGVAETFGFFHNFYPIVLNKKEVVRVNPMNLVINDVEWATTEAYFQAMKFEDKEYQEYIRNARTPHIVFKLGQLLHPKYITKKGRTKTMMIPQNVNTDDREYIKKMHTFEDKGVKQRNDWDKIKESIMYIAIKSKFDQNPQLKESLLKTGKREIVEHSYRDSYWGDGYDKKDKNKKGPGQNRLGLLLMNLRYNYTKTHTKLNLIS